MNGAARPEDRTARHLWLLFGVVWVAHLGISQIGWDHTLLNRFQFRQVQTAIATLFHPAGLPLPGYELPLFGPPWEAPLEFPIYQALVSTFVQASGMPLDPAGRLVAWALFQSALPAFFLLLGSLGVARGERPLFLALVVASPIYLFFSRCFLIESTALALALWFLAAFARWVASGGIGWLALAAAAGAGAAAVKLPTFAIVAGAAAIFTAARLWTAAGAPARLGTALRALAALVGPCVAAAVWQRHAAGLRALNPDTAFLDSMFGYFGFGDLALRLNPEFWTRTFGIWTDGLLSEGGLALALLGLVWSAPARRWLAAGAAVAFLSGQLVFANLYYVHDYYFYANGWLLLLAGGCGLTALLRAPSLPPAARVALVALVPALQLLSFARHYLPEQRVNTPVPELSRVVEKLTSPDDMIVVLGHDWDAGLAYYAQRRALMLTAGRERDPAAIARSVARLDPAKVGAVVLFGEPRDDPAFAAAALGALDLGHTPLLLGTTEKVGVWFPRDRHASVRDRMPAERYRTLAVVAPRPSDGAQVLGQREIRQLAEFDALGARPFRARAHSGFAASQVDGHRVLNAHPPTEMAFRPPHASLAVEFSFGLVDAAYANAAGATDGAEFVWAWRAADGTERILFSRRLDPAAQAADRGRQRVRFPAENLVGGELLLRILPGPSGNASFDWTYVGDIQFQPSGAH